MSILDFVRDNMKINKKDLYSIPYWDRVRMSQISVPTDAGWKLSGFLRIRDVDRSHNLVTWLDVVSDKYVEYDMVLYAIDNYNRNRLIKKVVIFHI